MHAVQPFATPARSAVRADARPPRRHRGAIVGVALAMGLLGGCYAEPDPSEWGPVAKKNFLAGCTEKVVAKGGTTTVVEIDSPSHCGCVYDAMVNTYRLSFEKMKEYESLQADAKAGDQPPTPPAELTKAIKKCRPVGPTPS